MRDRDMERDREVRERYERPRERGVRDKRYYDDIQHDRERIVALESGGHNSHVTINCSKPGPPTSSHAGQTDRHYENTKCAAGHVRAGVPASHRTLEHRCLLPQPTSVLLTLC